MNCIIRTSSISRSQPVSSLGRPCGTQFTTFPQSRVNQWIQSQLPSRHPPELPPDWPPPSTPPISRDHGLQVSLQTHSITAYKSSFESTLSRPPCASPHSLNYRLQVHLWVNSITASPHSLEPGLQVHLHTPSITACKYINKERLWVYGDTGVMEGTVTGSMYSVDPGVDRHHLLSISSYHIIKTHTLCFPTFGLNRSAGDFVDTRNCVDPPRRVVSCLPTRFLGSLSQHRSFSWIRFGFRKTSGAELMVGSVPSSSIVSPQRLPKGASVSVQWECPGDPPIMLDYHLWPD